MKETPVKVPETIMEKLTPFNDIWTPESICYYPSEVDTKTKRNVGRLKLTFSEDMLATEVGKKFFDFVKRPKPYNPEVCKEKGFALLAAFGDIRNEIEQIISDFMNENEITKFFISSKKYYLEALQRSLPNGNERISFARGNSGLFETDEKLPKKIKKFNLAKPVFMNKYTRFIPAEFGLYPKTFFIGDHPIHVKCYSNQKNGTWLVAYSFHFLITEIMNKHITNVFKDTEEYQNNKNMATYLGFLALKAFDADFVSYLSKISYDGHVSLSVDCPGANNFNRTYHFMNGNIKNLEIEYDYFCKEKSFVSIH